MEDKDIIDYLKTEPNLTMDSARHVTVALSAISCKKGYWRLRANMIYSLINSKFWIMGLGVTLPNVFLLIANV